MLKITFILNEFSLHNHLIENYLNCRPNNQVSIVKVPLVLRGKSRKDTAYQILPKLSKRFLFKKFQEFIIVFSLTLIPKLLKKGAVFRRLRAIAKLHGLDFHKSFDVMSEETLAFIKNKNPDIIVTLFHQILKEPLISIPRLGIINIHPGILPDFRGIQPYFWELLSEKKKAGPTFHYIKDASIDTGSILAQAEYSIPDNMSVHLNYYLTIKSASIMLPDLISNIENQNTNPLAQDTKLGNYYSWPDSKSIDLLYEKGHSMITWNDVLKITTGKFDKFHPEQTKFF